MTQTSTKKPTYPLSGISRAIDAGFGVMKFTRRAKKEEAKIAVNGLVCDSFQSVAIDTTKEQMHVDNSRKRDTVLVTYEGRTYELGKDVRHNMVASDFGRDMTDSYYNSPVYHALMRGTLAYMGDEHITTLVLGLPMNHFENKDTVAKLQEAYTGNIELSPGRSVRIDKVVVHPQPFGGYISLGHDLEGINKAIAGYPECGLPPFVSVDDLEKRNILIVDPGEFTLDWLLMTPGGQAQRVSSAVGDAGRHRVLREVHELVAKKLNRSLPNSFLTDIDVALREKTMLRIGGRGVDLTDPEFQTVIEHAVQDPVRQLLESLRGAEDRIDFVAVFGGSPVEVANAIRKARPYLPVYCPSEKTGQAAPMFKNLQGFQEWAEAVDEQSVAA